MSGRRGAEQEAFYRIGAVSRLTGLPANTIRTWERRHDAVQPQRSQGGGRLYSDDDIERLQLLKELSAQGHAIGELAPLSTEALAQRSRRSAEATGVEPIHPRPLRVALLHGSLRAALHRQEPEFATWEVVVDARHPDQLIADVANQDPVDVAVLELGLLGREPEAAYEACVEACGAEIIVVTYHFAAQPLLEVLADAGARLLRAPVELALLKRIVSEQHSTWTGQEPPEPVPPKYTPDQLSQLRSITSTVECECPHHLAQLVETLVAFERYSELCEQRFPKDVAIHRTLRKGTGQARMEVERLLQRLVAYEGIQLPPA
jgi:DNA-binding transcriptional MerR regulator